MAQRAFEHDEPLPFPPPVPAPLAPAAAPAPAAPAGPPPALPDALGRYRLHEELGRGGMGIVYRCEDPVLGRKLAVKVLLDDDNDPTVRQRFLDEAQIAGQLQHPGIVPVHELGTDAAGRPYFTMKLVEGETLDELLARRRSPADGLPRFLAVFEQVAQTLAYAHSMGVVHRDLKPSNVMVGRFGEVQVMDWGLAKVLGGGHAAAGPPPEAGRTLSHGPAVRTLDERPGSRTGAILGTVAYMAPEQARGEGDRVDARADVFALGALLCQVLTGQPPYVSVNPAWLLLHAANAELDGAYARLAACGADGELLALARHCLSAEPAARPGDGAAVAARVEAYRKSVQQRLHDAELAQARADEARAKARAERRARRLQVGLAAVLLFSGAVGLWVDHRWQEREGERARRAARDSRGVDRNLDAADKALHDKRWPEAQAALTRAGELLDDVRLADEVDLRQRWRQARAALALGMDLEELQCRWAAVGGQQGPPGASDYQAVLSGHGLDVLGGPPERVAPDIRDSLIREQVLVALDYWALASGPGPDAERILEVANAADEDAFRKGLRDDLRRGDGEHLRERARRADPDVLSAETLLVLAGALQDRDNAVRLQLLERAQRSHPQDFWLNLLLAQAFIVEKPARANDAFAYANTAVSLRRDSAVAHVLLGIASDRMGREDVAAAHFRAALVLKPGAAEVQQLLEDLGNRPQPAFWVPVGARLAWALFAEPVNRPPPAGPAQEAGLTGRLSDDSARLQHRVASGLNLQPACPPPGSGSDHPGPRRGPPPAPPNR